MSIEKESLIETVVAVFMNKLDNDKKMYILGFMEGVQAEKEKRDEQLQTQPA